MRARDQAHGRTDPSAANRASKRRRFGGDAALGIAVAVLLAGLVWLALAALGFALFG